MASPPDFANYSLCQSASAIIECKQFETSIKLLQCESVSFGDGSAEFSVCLWPIGPNGKGEPDGDYVYISLRHSTCPSEFWVKFEVSLIDFLGEKQFTKTFGKASSELEKERINACFCSRERILASPFTYLRNGTLKVLFEVFLFEQGPIAHLTPLTSDYASLLETGAYSDVTLVVGKKKFPVHKTILTARSPVFARMFNSNFKESKKNRVVLEDMSEQVLQELLNFIYTERVENLEEFASELLMVAEKYQIESLKAICGHSLCATINTDTLLPLLQMATLYNVPELKRKCLTFFADHSKEIKLSAEWKQLIITEGNPEILGLLLQSVMLTE